MEECAILVVKLLSLGEQMFYIIGIYVIFLGDLVMSNVP
jgi:hypothetical protein